MTRLSRVRHKVLRREYYLSAHAEEEMVEDRLERRDIERAILRGRIDKKLTRDLRGEPLPDCRPRGRWPLGPCRV